MDRNGIEWKESKSILSLKIYLIRMIKSILIQLVHFITIHWILSDNTKKKKEKKKLKKNDVSKQGLTCYNDNY